MRNFQDEIGRIVDGRYKLLDLLGSGSAGAVFRAYDTKLQRQVAVKLFDTTEGGREHNISFMTEAKAVSSLVHENIVRLYDAGAEERDRYLVMEYTDGTTLRSYIDHRRLRGQRIPQGEILNCAKQVLLGLSEAHKHRIVHRDVKPQNIIVMKTGKIRVMDFGIALLPGKDVFEGESHAVGTAHYISPEQAAGNIVDQRSDIYSLGVVLYEMATGVLPYTGMTPSEIAQKHVQGALTPPRTIDPSISLGLEQIILTAMSHDVDCRFSSAEEMLRAVEKLQKNPTYVFGDFARNKSTKTGERRRSAEKSTVVPALVAAVSALCAITVIVFGILLTQGLRSDSVTVTMPRLIGEHYDESRSYGDHITIETVEYAYSDTVQKGAIIRHTPSAGQVYSERIAVSVVVSLGEEPILPASLVGNTEAEALSLLKKKKINPIVEYVPSDTVAKGSVAEAVSPDAEMVSGSLCTLYISVGAAETVAVPSLVGKDKGEALALLEELGILYHLTFAENKDIAEGEIIEQSVAAGENVRKGVTADAVILTVSKGLSG